MAWDGRFTGTSRKRADRPNANAQLASDYHRKFRPTKVADALKINGRFLAFHHVISWELLSGTWNRLIDDGHLFVIHAWLRAVGFDNVGNIYPTGEAQTPWTVIKAMRAGADLNEIADTNAIHQRVSWSVWNLVEGPEPTRRSDDPESSYDQFSTIRTLTPLERSNLQRVDTLYGMMAALDLSNPIPIERARALGMALLAVNRTADIIKFRDDMWIASGGKWRKNT